MIRFCKYIDIPIQHISDNILKKVRRKGRSKNLTDNINKLGILKFPNIVLRTSL